VSLSDRHTLYCHWYNCELINASLVLILFEFEQIGLH